MRYIDQTLQLDEPVVYRATKLTADHIARGIVWILAAVVLVIVANKPLLAEMSNLNDHKMIFSVVLDLLAIFLAAVGIVEIYRADFIELVVTDRRIIYKRGLRKYTTISVGLSCIDSVSVQQSVFSGSGNVTIKTTGGTTLTPDVFSPLMLCRVIYARLGAGIGAHHGHAGHQDIAPSISYAADEAAD